MIKLLTMIFAFGIAVAGALKLFFGDSAKQQRLLDKIDGLEKQFDEAIEKKEAAKIGSADFHLWWIESHKLRKEINTLRARLPKS